MERRLEGHSTMGYNTEALAGAAAAVLAIIGLAGVVPVLMVSIAGIVLGASLLLEGGLLMSEYSRAVSAPGEGAPAVGVSMNPQTMAAIAVVVLGILSLLRLEPTILMPIAAIVLGAGFMLGAGVTANFNEARIDLATEGNETARRIAHDASTATTGSQVLVGLAAVVLGIVAVVGFIPTILTLVAWLTIGSAILLSSSSTSGRVMGMFFR